jgi:hypothetical protein
VGFRWERTEVSHITRHDDEVVRPRIWENVGLVVRTLPERITDVLSLYRFFLQVGDRLGVEILVEQKALFAHLRRGQARHPLVG